MVASFCLDQLHHGVEESRGILNSLNLKPNDINASNVNQGQNDFVHQQTTTYDEQSLISRSCGYIITKDKSTKARTYKQTSILFSDLKSQTNELKQNNMKGYSK